MSRSEFDGLGLGVPAHPEYDRRRMSNQGQPSRNREWEHWPGRREGDEGIRHRLRTLFTHSDVPGDRMVEELLAERGRELEERTAQLAATVADMQRREEKARELRVAVEDMLRRGSSELDERHAELNALAAELTVREQALRESEEALAERRQELGAVELRRAAVERRDEALNEREAALERIAGELQERETTLREREQDDAARALPAPAVEPPAEASHLVFAAGDRYRLVERDGPPPAPGATIEVDSAQLAVRRLGPSPIPGDRRRCAYAEPLDG